MSSGPDLTRLRRRLSAVRAAVLAGEAGDPGQIRDLLFDVEQHIEGLRSAAPADPAHLLALLDEAGALRDALHRGQEVVRQTIEADRRRRLGRVAYQRPRAG